MSARDRDQDFLLKIHRPHGSSAEIDPEYVEAALVWLDDLSGMSPGFPVQRPIPDREGRLLPRVNLVGLGKPTPCSLQTWVEGEPSHEDLTEGQAEAIGAMTAGLHTCASRWIPSRPVVGQVLDAEWFATRLRELNSLVDPDIVTPADQRVLGAAGQIVGRRLTALGTSSAVFGPIHGDLHQQNIVFSSGSPRPIDFAFLRLAPYLWDLGVMAYHTMYLPTAVRRALIESYTSSRDVAVIQEMDLETFLVSAAIDNLAFQLSIPEQLTSPGLRRNLDQLMREYCPSLIAGETFVLARRPA